jgi:Na+/proline symporter
LPAALIAVGGFTGMFDKLNAIDPGLTEPFYGWYTPLNAVCFPFYYFIIYLAHPYVSRMYLALKSDSWREFFKFSIAFIAGCSLGTILGLLGNIGRAMGITVTPPFGADMIGVEVAARVAGPALFTIYAVGIVVAVTSTSEDWLHTTAVGIGHDLVEGIPEIPGGVKKVALTISKWTIPIIVAIAAVFTAVSPPPYLSLFLYNASVIVNSIFFLPLIFALLWKKATLPAAIASIFTSLFCGAWLFDYLWAGTQIGASPYIRNVFAIAVGFVVYIIVNLIVLAIRGEKAVPQEWVKKAFGES